MIGLWRVGLTALWVILDYLLSFMLKGDLNLRLSKNTSETSTRLRSSSKRKRLPNLSSPPPRITFLADPSLSRMLYVCNFFFDVDYRTHWTGFYSPSTVTTNLLP